MVLLFAICIIVLCGLLLVMPTAWVILFIAPVMVGAVSAFPRGLHPQHRTLLILIVGLLSCMFTMLHSTRADVFEGWRYQPFSANEFDLTTGTLQLLLLGVNALLCIAHLRMSDHNDRWALLYVILAAPHALNGRYGAWTSAWVALALLLMMGVRCVSAFRFSATSLERCACVLVLGVGVTCFVYPYGGHWIWPLAAACASLLGGSSVVLIAAVPVMAWYSEVWGESQGFMPDGLESMVAIVLWGSIGIGLVRSWRARQKCAAHVSKSASTRTASVVIPVRNEADHIQYCLKSALRDACVCEAIVVDGGSTDETVALAECAGARVVRHDGSGGPGRGGHIRAGVAAAKGDVVFVVHADTEMVPDAIQSAVERLQRQPHAVGGAVGSVFDSRRLMLRCIEAANDFRAAFMGISFGDQVQFFRRQVALEHDLVPDYPLMEDVELSMRFKRYGSPVYRFGSARVSPRSWGDGSRKRAVLIIRLVAAFLWARRRGTPDVDKMYRQYYGDRSAS